MKPILQCFAIVLINLFFFTTTLLAQIPANNNCANAILISTDSVCAGGSYFTGQTLMNATADGGAIASGCTAIASEDVWYKFVAKTAFPTITIGSLGTSWGTRLKIQLLTGVCGSFTEKLCVNDNLTLTPALTNGLTPGTMYYIRIYKNNIAAPTGSNWGFTICVTDAFQKGSRMNEIFSRTVLSTADVLDYPWEVTYGRDNYLWVTEAKGYKVQRIDPNTGVKTLVLDISQGSNFLPVAADRTAFNCQIAHNGAGQGGFAGLALHPNFMDGTANEKNYVYISYIFSGPTGSSPSGIFYNNKLVRFTFSGGVLGSPVLIANLPGSGDHNSQRMIIAPCDTGVGKYLFYASGDMGAGQFGNRTRAQNAQVVSNVEGKILRYNLDTVGGIPWIPTSNPYPGTTAVWCMGMRNNQGFAFDSTLKILYGSSHGAYSDDEINIIKPKRNYGHPLVIGYADGNYNADTTVANTRVSAGAPFTDGSGVSSCPPISSEQNRMNNINTNAAVTGAYQGPLFSAYPTARATIQSTWTTNPGNAGWLSEGWSGLDIYQNKIIPGWGKSLVASGLKWGRLLRLRLSTTGLKTLPSNLDSANTSDTITYFQSTNRYRDLAFTPSGKDLFVIMDNSSATSGPGVGNPITPACPGCLIKYSFLGYADAGGLSTIPKSVPVSTGNTGCNTGTPVTIDGTNNFLWVPITGPDGNIMAEINAMGQSLGLVTSSYYQHSGATRYTGGGSRYLNRNITITPTVTTFPTAVKVRLYISKAEFDAFAADPLSGVTGITQLKVLKNSDPCSASIGAATTLFNPSNTLLADLTHGATNGYVLQISIPSFSSFYFAGNNVTLPMQLLTFTGSLQNNAATLLKWKTTNEINTSHFIVERSGDAQNFEQIGRVTATGNSSEANYTFNDPDVVNQLVLNVFYRLKMYDADGTYKYSNIVKVSLSGIESEMTITPNPAITDVKASVISAEACDAEWQIIDMSGRVLLKNTTSLKKGKNELNINMSQIASGSYYLAIKGTCIDLKNKFQKL